MINIHSISVAVVNIFIIYFVLVKNTTLGLNTNSCNHEEIKAHIKDFFDCMYGMKDEKIAATIKAANNETTQWCNLLKKETICFTQSLGSCLEQKITEDLETLYLYQNLRAEEISCYKIGNRSTTDIFSDGSRLMTDYFTDIQMLNKIISFEKNCNTIDLVNSMLRIGSNIKKEGAHLRQIIDSYFREVFFKQNEDAEINSLPVCQTAVAIADNCFKEDKCLSEDEMTLAQSVIMTYYKLSMILTADFNVIKGKSSKMDKINRVFTKLALADYQVIIIIKWIF